MRSTQNLSRHGWPAFDCGGFYTRGLILQYLAALLAQLGIPLDVAPRLISAVSSLLALPAVFVLGRRMHSRTFGLVAVAIMALSVWETEIGRFGRMYAPFQAVFLWYLVFFLRRTVDRDRRAECPMIILTVVGTLLWEGGVFLALANFLPVFLQKPSVKLLPRDWAVLAGFVVVCVVSYWFVTTDFRLLGGTPPLPLDYDSSVVTTVTPPGEPPSLWIRLSVHRGWLALFLLPLALSAWAARIAWLRRETLLSAAALIAALVAAVAHQFLAAAAVLTLASVFRFASWEQLTSNAARTVYGAIGICALFWLSFVSSIWAHPTDGPLWKAALSFVHPLVSLPDLLDQVIRPWASAVPMLSVGLLLLVGAAVGRLMRQDKPGISNERAVTAVFICMLLAASASDTPRHETRYVFFLYPLAVLIALMTVDNLIRMSARHERARALMTPVLGLGLFMLSEDFRPRHLLTIDQPATIFRYEMTAAQQSHLVTRDNSPALAQWLRHHAASGDVVVSAYQSLDYYYPKTQFFYVERSDYNFESYACRYGTVDRWSNRPLLQSAQALATLISGTSTTYLVTYSARVEQLLEPLSRYHPVVEWQEGHLAVLAFDARTQTPRSP